MNKELQSHAEAALSEFGRVVADYHYDTAGLTANARLLAHANKALKPTTGGKELVKGSEIDVDAYLSLLRGGERPIAAARQLGIDPMAIRRRMQFDPAFRDLVQLAEEEAAEVIEDQLYKLAKDGEKWAVQEWLRKRVSGRWGEDPTVIQHQGTVNHEVGAKGSLLEEIAGLQQILIRRAELGSGPYIDAEVIEEG